MVSAGAVARAPPRSFTTTLASRVSLGVLAAPDPSGAGDDDDSIRNSGMSSPAFRWAGDQQSNPALTIVTRWSADHAGQGCRVCV